MDAIEKTMTLLRVKDQVEVIGCPGFYFMFFDAFKKQYPSRTEKLDKTKLGTWKIKIT